MAVKGPYNDNRPICRDEREDCNRRREDGSCELLTDTAFSKPCPFYKSVDEREADLDLKVIVIRH